MTMSGGFCCCEKLFMEVLLPLDAPDWRLLLVPDPPEEDSALDVDSAELR